MAKENWFARPLEEQEGVFVDYKQFDVKKQLTASQFQYEFEAIPNRVNYDSTQKNNEDQSMFLLKTGIDMLFVEKNKNQINFYYVYIYSYFGVIKYSVNISNN